MIPFQVNRIRTLALVALGLACTPANGTQKKADGGATVGTGLATTTRADTAPVSPAVAAQPDSDVVKADLARIQGSATAPIWVIEVSDFQCPYCKQCTQTSELRDEVSQGKVRLAKQLPLAHKPHAGRSEAAGAGAQGIWEMHEALFTLRNVGVAVVDCLLRVDDRDTASRRALATVVESGR